MSRNRSAFRLLVPSIAIALAFVSAGPMSADDDVPLKGKFAGAGVAFSGTFSHLGAFTGVVDLGTGAAVWTAADGDTVTVQTTAFVIDFANPISATVFPYTQSIAITGGTGRFTGATGAVEVVGTIDVVSFAYDGIVNGAISRPNSGN